MSCTASSTTLVVVVEVEDVVGHGADRHATIIERQQVIFQDAERPAKDLGELQR